MSAKPYNVLFISTGYIRRERGMGWCVGRADAGSWSCA